MNTTFFKNKVINNIFSGSVCDGIIKGKYSVIYQCRNPVQDSILFAVQVKDV